MADNRSRGALSETCLCRKNMSLDGSTSVSSAARSAPGMPVSVKAPAPLSLRSPQCGVEAGRCFMTDLCNRGARDVLMLAVTASRGLPDAIRAVVQALWSM
jgi:hypothetical protein